MGIGGGIFLITLGAILRFAVHSRVSWIDLKAVGVVLMLAGVAMLILTFWLWSDRRRRMGGGRPLVEQSQMVHQSGPVAPSPPDTPPANKRPTV